VAASEPRCSADKARTCDDSVRLNRAYHLETQESPAGGVRRIALGRADKALEELRRANQGDEVSAAVHRARKQLKKLRAALRLVRDHLGEALYKKENNRYRDAARMLSATRDAEAKAETLEALCERFGDALPEGAVSVWRDALEREAASAGEAVKEGKASPLPEAIEMVEKGRDRISAWPLQADSWALVDKGLTRTYRRGRRAMKRVADDPTAENLHEWRKRAKDLWHQLQIVQNAWASALVEVADRAHELADLLGDHHDLVILSADLTTRRLGGPAEGALAGAISRRQEEHLAAALDLGSRLYAEKTKAFRRRMRRYWVAWRD